MHYVKNLNVFEVDAQQIPCITGEGAPTTETEGAEGCLYMDIAGSGAIYKCISAVDSVYTWELNNKIPVYIHSDNTIKIGDKTYNTFSELSNATGISFNSLYQYYDFYYVNEYDLSELGGEPSDNVFNTEYIPMIFERSSDSTGYVQGHVLMGIGHCYTGTPVTYTIGECQIKITYSEDSINISRTPIEEGNRIQWKIEHHGDYLDVYRNDEASSILNFTKEVILGGAFDSYDVILDSPDNFYGNLDAFICKLDSLYHITTAGENEYDYVLYGTIAEYIVYFKILSSSDNEYECYNTDIIPINKEPDAITVTEELYKGRRYFIVKQGDTEIAKIEAMGKLTGDQLLSWLMTDYANSTLSGDYSVSLGFANTSSGNGNIIGGIKNNATGRAMGVFGEGNKVTKCATGAIIGGKYADVDDDTVVFAIGNGTNDSARSNLFVIHADGTITGALSSEEVPF